MLSRLIRQFLFTLVHLFVNIIVSIRYVYHQFLHKKPTTDDVVKKDDLKKILEQMPRISKLPKHLVVLYNFEHQGLNDLAHVVIWSLVAGIPYVSFYDSTGKKIK